MRLRLVLAITVLAVAAVGGFLWLLIPGVTEAGWVIGLAYALSPFVGAVCLVWAIVTVTEALG